MFKSLHIKAREQHNMKPFVSLIVMLTLSLQLKAANYCEKLVELPEKWTQIRRSVHNDCCEITDGQWNLIVWYFLRVGSNINLTQIVRASESCQYERYVNHFISDLYKYTNLEYILERVIYQNRDQILDKQREIQFNSTYKWHIVEEPDTDGYPEYRFLLRQFRNKLSKRNCIREDEPRYGSVILASDITLIDEYLNGNTRYPFDSKLSHYVILIYGDFDSERWDDLAASIMTKLWKKHGILDAIILASCNPTRVRSTAINFAIISLIFAFCLFCLSFSNCFFMFKNK